MSRKTGIFVLIAWSLTGAAWAEVAMLTQVTGDVTLSGKEGARAAVPFLKVNEGDTLTLAKGARVQMVYFGNGRQEVWTGNGQIEVRSTEGRSGSLEARTSQLPPLVVNQLVKTPAPGQTGSTGMVTVRSLDALDAGEQLEMEYESFRASATPDDTTPEVFFLSGLLDLREYERARQVLGELKTRQLTQPAYEALVDHFGPLIDRAAVSPSN